MARIIAELLLHGLMDDVVEGEHVNYDLA